VGGILARQPWAAIERFVPAAADGRVERLVQLRRFVELLLQWNRRVSNLISKNDESRVVEAHLVPSLEPAEWIASHRLSRWLDFGSGGGFPAIPLALCGVGEHWDLVESRRTKTLFLKRAVEQLGLSQVRVITERLENLVAMSGVRSESDARASADAGRERESGRELGDALSEDAGRERESGRELGDALSADAGRERESGWTKDDAADNSAYTDAEERPSAGGREDFIYSQHLLPEYDGFTSRATLALGPTLELAARTVRPGGFAFLWKGTKLDEELAAAKTLGSDWREEERRPLSNGMSLVIKLKRLSR